MHRSGTSAVARTLNLCGASLGKDLLAPKGDNERGFWENTHVLGLHEKFLQDIGFNWHDLAFADIDWLSEARIAEFRRALGVILREQFGAKRLCLIKDPRLSWFAPLWVDVLRRRHRRAVFVVTVRHPDEVAASLAKRDGFSIGYSRLLWLRHMINAERVSRGHPRVFVHYERLLLDWRSEVDRVGRQLDIDWPVPIDSVSDEISAYLSPALRHHRHGTRKGSAQSLPEWIERVYRLACEATSSTSPDIAASFDSTLTEFDASMRLCAPVFDELTHQADSMRRAHTREISAARRVINKQSREINRARTQIEALAAEIENARTAHSARDRIEADLRQDILNHQQATSRLQQDIDNLVEILKQKDVEIDQARTNIDSLVDDLAQAKKLFASKDTEIDHARGHIEALVADLGRAREIISSKDAEIDQARTNIDSLVDELAQAKKLFASKDAEIDRAREVIAGKDQEIEQARKIVETQAAQIETARALVAAKDQEIDRARNNFETTAKRVEHLNTQIEQKHAELESMGADIDAIGAKFADRNREIDQARSTVNSLSNDLETMQRTIAGKDAEISAMRGTIDAMQEEIEQARLAHKTRDITEAQLHDELAKLHHSTWIRLGRTLHLMKINSK